MDIEKLLTALHYELERINAAIIALERLSEAKDSSGSTIKRRGRPPGSKNKISPSAPQL